MNMLPEWLYGYLMKLDKETLLDIMEEALDAMQAYNGRSPTYCIVSAIPNAKIEETDRGYRYQLPKLDNK